MIPLIICCAGAACLSATLIHHMIRIGVMDVPGHRSSHTRPTPKGGGIGIIVAFLLVFPLTQLWTEGHLPDFSLLMPLLGVALLALFSWLDDIHSYRAALKLGVQGVTALMALAGTTAIPALFTLGAPIWLAGLLSAAIGFVWLVYTTNALNFIDGLNGLASGVMMISALVLAALFHHTGVPALTHASLILAAALLAFLPFNFPRARIFMGDVGSQGAGLAIAWLGIEAASTTRAPLVVPFLLSGVLFDVGFTLIRRALAKDSLTQAHRGHLYQLAVRSGLSPVMVSLVHWGFALWGGILCLQPLSLAVRLSLLLVTQMIWAGLVITRARSRDLGKW